MSDDNNQNTPPQNPYDVYNRYITEQNRIWTNWWTQVLKNVWGIKE